ncbi:hypothetical protein HanIR_Chr15g0751721 [Helianthus annuus]|nr:hypothetical protein HanIR_Chr15g0751721 [Helianthus annuus]
MDPVCNRFNTQNRVIRLWCHRILHPIKIFPRANRRLQTQILQITLEFRCGQIRVDPIIFQITRTPKRATRFRRVRISRLPDANNSFG